MTSDQAVARRSGNADAGGALTVYLLLLLAIPSRLTIGALGGAGSPATVLGAGCLVLWMWLQVLRERPRAGEPIRRALLWFVLSIVVSFAVASARPGDPEDLQAAQLTVLIFASWIGVALLALDGLASRTRLEVILERISIGAGLFAGLGLLQALTGQQLVDAISLPGLSLNGVLAVVGDRAGFFRPSSTAIHGIEYGVTVALLLPLVLHVALHHKRLGRMRRWLPVAACVTSVPLSVSRSAVVCAAVSLLVLVLGWNGRQRTWSLAALFLFGLAQFVALPGLVGTLAKLFSGAGGDASVLSRTDSYAVVGYFFEQSPWLGRGLGTFLPKYRILDNQYAGILIESGVLGLLAVVVLVVTVIVTMRRVRQESADGASRHLAQAFAASIVSASVGFAFFDGYSFPLFCGMTFLILGLAGSLARPKDGDAAMVGRRRLAEMV